MINTKKQELAKKLISNNMDLSDIFILIDSNCIDTLKNSKTLRQKFHEHAMALPEFNENLMADVTNRDTYLSDIFISHFSSLIDECKKSEILRQRINSRSEEFRELLSEVETIYNKILKEY